MVPDTSILQKLIATSIKHFRRERKEIKKERRTFKKKTILKYFSVKPNLGDHHLDIVFEDSDE